MFYSLRRDSGGECLQLHRVSRLLKGLYQLLMFATRLTREFATTVL